VSRQPLPWACSPLEYGSVVVCVAGVAAFWAFEEASGSKPNVPASVARFRSVEFSSFAVASYAFELSENNHGTVF